MGTAPDHVSVVVRRMPTSSKHKLENEGVLVHSKKHAVYYTI